MPGAPSAEKYRRVLDLDTAVASVSYASNGTNFQREVFSSAPASVIVAHFVADKPGSISVRMTLKRAGSGLCERSIRSECNPVAGANQTHR